MGSHLPGYLTELTIRGLCGCSRKNPRNTEGKTQSSLAEADSPNLYTCLHIYNMCHLPTVYSYIYKERLNNVLLIVQLLLIHLHPVGQMDGQRPIRSHKPQKVT